MFNFPSKRSIMRKSEYRAAPISRTTVLGKDILNSVKERNQRVEIRDKIMNKCSDEKKDLTNQFKSSTGDIKEAHQRAIIELEKECSEAKQSLSNNAQLRLTKLSQLKARQILSEKNEHGRILGKLKSDYENKQKIVKSLEGKILECSDLRKNDLSKNVQNEQSLKRTISKGEEKISQLEKNISNLMQEKIALVRMTDDIDKELKASFKYVTNVAENDINSSLMTIKKISEAQVNEIDSIISSNDKLKLDIDDAVDVNINKQLKVLTIKMAEQKRLGRVQGQMIISKLNASHKLEIDKIISGSENKIKSIDSDQNKEITMVTNEYENKIRKLTNDIDEKQDTVERMRKDHIKEIDDNKSKCAISVKELKDQINKLNIDHLKIVTDNAIKLTVLTSDNKKLKKLEIDLRQEIHDEKKQVSLLEERISVLKEAHMEKLNDINNGEKTVLAELKKAESIRQRDIDKLKSDCKLQADSLTKALLDKGELEKKVNKLTCEVNQSKIAIGLSAPDLKHCKISHSDLVERINSITESNKEVLKRANNLSKDSNKLNEINSSLESLTRRYDALNKEKNRLSDRLSKSQTLVGDKTSEMATNKEELSSLKAVIKRLEAGILKHTNKEKLSDKLELEIQNRNKDLNAQLLSLNTSKTGLERDITKLSCEIKQSKKAIGLDTKELKYCKVTYSDLENKILNVIKSTEEKDGKIGNLETANRLLVDKNRELERMIPKMATLEKELKVLKDVSKAKVVDNAILNRASALSSTNQPLRNIKVDAQLKILEKAVYMPWTLANCYGKVSQADRVLCAKYEGFGDKFKRNEVQKMHGKNEGLVRFSGFSTRLSGKTQNADIRRKLMIIENTGFVTKEFKENCVNSDGSIKGHNLKCQLPRRNYGRNIDSTKTGLNNLSIRADFRF